MSQGSATYETSHMRLEATGARAVTLVMLDFTSHTPPNTIISLEISEVNRFHLNPTSRHIRTTKSFPRSLAVKLIASLVHSTKQHNHQNEAPCSLPPPPDRSVGIDCDEERVTSLLKELEGKDINELIAEGSSKLASVPSGGSGAASGGAAAASSGGAAAEAPVEEKEEEKEESDEDMGFGLFD